jgi:hypothetical protein
VVPAPSGGGTSLSASAAGDKSLIESWIGVANSPYYRGTEDQAGTHRPAAWVQQRYQDLIRAEQRGAKEAIGPDFGPDYDMPAHVGGYDISRAPGANAMGAADRALVDSFLDDAFDGGIGQAKAAQAIGWALGVPDLTETKFRDLAIAAGWSDEQIAVCLRWHASVAAASGRSHHGLARSDIAARKAEIEGLMYIDGMPNPAYFGGPLESEYRALIAAEIGT